MERPFRYIRQDFFLDRNFQNLEDLNGQFDLWRSGIANVRTHGTTPASYRSRAPATECAITPNWFLNMCAPMPPYHHRLRPKNADALTKKQRNTDHNYGLSPHDLTGNFYFGTFGNFYFGIDTRCGPISKRCNRPPTAIPSAPIEREAGRTSARSSSKEVAAHFGRKPKDNPRFVVTNLKTTPRHIYETVYCARGVAENRLKELKLGLEIDRTSCTSFLANQFRVLMTAAAYVLMQELRLRARRTGCARAQVATLRLRLLKLGAWIESSVRRVVIHLPIDTPFADDWWRIAPRSAPS